MVTGKPPLGRGTKGAAMGTAVFHFFKKKMTRIEQNINTLILDSNPWVFGIPCFSECLKYFVIKHFVKRMELPQSG